MERRIEVFTEKMTEENLTRRVGALLGRRGKIGAWTSHGQWGELWATLWWKLGCELGHSKNGAGEVTGARP